jgi:organic hydroperoxide reductase OsmC/OhrA
MTVQPYPHTYTAFAVARATELVAVSAPQLPFIETSPPPEFGGPGGLWSPETLLCGAVADCFILTFRAVARGARFDWLTLDCRVEGTLERLERVSQFTRFTTTARLEVPPGADIQKAHRLLAEAEQGCLIANSLRGTRTLKPEVIAASE